MDIGIVVNRFSAVEGTGGYAAGLVSYLANRHDVTVYASGFSGVPDGVRTVKVPVSNRREYFNALSFPGRFERIRREHDVVHAQGFVARRADIVTAHTVVAGWRRAARQHTGALGLGERIFGSRVERGEKHLFGGARTVIAPSESARDHIRKLYGVYSNVVVVPHGFPPPSSRARQDGDRARYGLPENAFVVLYAGDARKGLARALECIAATSDAHLLVVSRSAGRRFRELAGRLKIDDRVTFSGPLDGLADVFPLVDALLYPTIFDTFGLVVSEALASGLPAVVSGNAGVSELLSDGVDALVYNDNDTEAAVSALMRLREDDALRMSLGEGGRNVAAAHSWSVCFDRTMALYDAGADRA